MRRQRQRRTPIRSAWSALEEAIIHTGGTLPHTTRREVRDLARDLALLPSGQKREDPTSALIAQVARAVTTTSTPRAAIGG